MGTAEATCGRTTTRTAAAAEKVISSVGRTDGRGRGVPSKHYCTVHAVLTLTRVNSEQRSPAMMLMTQRPPSSAQPSSAQQRRGDLPANWSPRWPPRGSPRRPRKLEHLPHVREHARLVIRPKPLAAPSINIVLVPARE